MRRAHVLLLDTAREADRKREADPHVLLLDRAREADRKREADLRIEARQVREANKARTEASKCLILHSTESRIP